MGRLSQGHFDDVFLDKIKQVCIHVLDQLNQANEIHQAFDLCPSISRRNRVILNFLRDADQLTESASSGNAAASSSSSSASPLLPSLRPPTSIRPSREPSLGTDSVASLSAQRRRRAREMQYVRDPNDSNDDSDSQANTGPSTSRPAHLDPSSARSPNMSQPDYTFEQFVHHLDPTDKLLKRSFEIIIKETARHALAKKRDPLYDPTTSSADPAASLRSAIASSRSNRTTAFNPYRNDPFARSRQRNLANDIGDPTSRQDRNSPHTLRDFLLSSTQGSLGSTRDLMTSARHLPPSRNAALPSDSSPHHPPRPSRSAQNQDTGPSSISADSFEPQPAQRVTGPPAGSTTSFTPQVIASRLAEASRRNAVAARTIRETENLRSNQLIRTSIESLRASLFQLHADLTCAQLQHAHLDNTATPRANSTVSYLDLQLPQAVLINTIELFDDILRRLSCLVSNTNSDPNFEQRPPISQQNAISSQIPASLWRVRNLLPSMVPHPNDSDHLQTTSNSVSEGTSEAELRAHQHLLATMEESRWSRADTDAPTPESIRAWRRKLAVWYHLDRDRTQYPDAPQIAGNQAGIYGRWHPDLEIPYALEDQAEAPSLGGASSARPDPIANPQGAWAFVRARDAALADDLNQDAEVRAALQADSVTAALQRLLSLRGASEPPATSSATNHRPQETATTPSNPAASAEDADPDVSLTRTTSLGRRNAIRGQPLSSSDGSSIRSVRSSLSQRRLRDSLRQSIDIASTVDVDDDNDAGEEDVVETSMEIGTVPHSPDVAPQPADDAIESSNLRPPSERPRAGRSGSFTFVTTPAAVLRSTRQGRSDPQPVALDDLDEDDEEDSEAEAYLDLGLDLDIGMAGADAFDFDLVDFLRSESRRAASDLGEEFSPSPPRMRRSGDGAGSADASGSTSPTGIRVFVSGSGASTPAEARQATFEAYAQRARMLRRRRRQEEEGQHANTEEGFRDAAGGSNGSEEISFQHRRRRRGQNAGHIEDAGDGETRRNSLPFPRASER